VLDDVVPSVTFEYKTRLEAELAFIKGKTFKDRALTLTWAQDAVVTVAVPNNNADDQTLAGENGAGSVGGSGSGDSKQQQAAQKVAVKTEPEDVRAIIKREEEELDFDDDDEEDDNVSVVTDRHKSSASSFDENSLLGEDVS
jgi:hypothetical protein